MKGTYIELFPDETLGYPSVKGAVVNLMGLRAFERSKYKSVFGKDENREEVTRYKITFNV